MNWPFLVGVLACAGLVQGMTGFGFGLISMSLLPALFGVKKAAALGTIYGLFATSTTFLRHGRDYDWRLGRSFLASSCLGVPLGVYFLEKSSEEFLLKMLGLLMVVFSLREFLVKHSLASSSCMVSVPFGLFSGSLSGAFNLGGIPTAAYAYAHPWKQGQIIAFLQVMIVSSSVLRLMLYNKIGCFQEFSWGRGLLVLIPLFMALSAGHWLMRRLPPTWLRKGVFIFIGVAGLYYLFLHGSFETK